MWNGIRPNGLAFLLGKVIPRFNVHVSMRERRLKTAWNAKILLKRHRILHPCLVNYCMPLGREPWYLDDPRCAFYFVQKSLKTSQHVPAIFTKVGKLVWTCPKLNARTWVLGDVIRREVCRVGFDQRNPKPETRNRLLELVSNCETRNPKPETDSEDLTSPGPIETRNPKPETDSEDLTSPEPIETRNPKPETHSEDLTSPGPIETRNPKPETDSEDLTSPEPIETRNPNPETRNPKPTAEVGFKRRNPKPETDSNPTFAVALRIGTQF